MKINKLGFYSVAPLDDIEQDEIASSLLKESNGGGILTYDICKTVSLKWKSKRNMCYIRKDGYRPCNTLCSICVNILYKINQQMKEVK